MHPHRIFEGKFMGILRKIDYCQRMNSSTNQVSLKDIFSVFLKLGLFGFGGPAAHVAMMRKEVVEKRNWLSQQEFLDLWGATQLIPGPNSTELAIHIGFELRRWSGLLVAGITFILPAFALVLLLAVFYHEFSHLGALQGILSGIRPVIIAIVLDALIKIRPQALKNSSTWLLALMSLILSFLGAQEVLLVLGLGLGYACFFPNRLNSFFLLPIALTSGLQQVTGASVFLFFLKIGSVLFGSGYVLLAFLQSELVDERMWLTQKQLLDAITVGQITPGPVFTTATFIGYLLKSYEGAVLATVGIFLPSFFFVAISAPFMNRLKASPFFRKFLDAVNAVSFALLLKVSYELAKTSLMTWPTFLIGLITFLLFLKFKQLNSIWPILVSGVIGYIFFS